MRKIAWKWFTRLLLLALLLVGALIATAFTIGFPRTAAGMAAKTVCSGVFVAGRTEDDVLANDLWPASAVLQLMRVQVLRGPATVRAHLPAGTQRVAAYDRVRGCVLLPVGEEALAQSSPQPLAVPTPAQPLLTQATPPSQWPATINAQQLQATIDAAFAGGQGPAMQNTRAALVVHQGRLLAEAYAPGYNASTRLHGWSMTKTVLGMLAYKRAQEQGFSLDAPVVSFFQSNAPAWVAQWRGDARANIRVADLMYMRDGLSHEEGYQPWSAVTRMLWDSPDIAAFVAQGSAQASAGERWRYLSATTNMLSRVLRESFASDAAYLAYPAQAVFGPIGADSALIETDAAGHWIGSSYLWANARDWARLGLLMLQDGRWGEAQVLPPGWLAYARTPATPEPRGQTYGAQTWLVGKPNSLCGANHGLPADTVAMSGHWGQTVAIIPSKQLVIVRLGWSMNREQWNGCEFVREVAASVG